MIFRTIKFYTRETIKSKPNELFVFGDNLVRMGYGGQAKAARGEPNAVGIPTKVKPDMTASAFLSDDQFDRWLEASRSAFDRIQNHNDVVNWPEDGIGTGLAKLNATAPKIFACLTEIRDFFALNNSSLNFNKTWHNIAKSYQEEKPHSCPAIR